MQLGEICLKGMAPPAAGSMMTTSRKNSGVKTTWGRARDHGYRSSREPQRRATQRMCHVMLPSCHVALLEERAGKKKKEQQLNEQFLRCFLYWPV